MREQEFRARDKKIQKMTRDGLTEQNLSQGTGERLSSRIADVSFGKEKREDTAAGHRAQNRAQKKGQAKTADTRGYMTPEQEGDRFADVTAPEVWGPQNAPVSMRDAGDKPVLSEQLPDMGSGPPERGGKKQCRPAGKTAEKEGTPEPEKKPSDIVAHSRLQFGSKAIKDTTRIAAYRTAGKTKQVADASKTESELEKGAAPVSRHSRLRFEHEDVKDTAEITTGRSVIKKKQSVKFGAGARAPDGAPRLHYEKSELPPAECAATEPRGGTQPSGRELQNSPRQQKRYERAKRRVETADRKLEKAQEKIPTRRRIQLRKQYDSESGRVRQCLQFEAEAVPENENLPLPKRAGRAAATAVFEVHRKISEDEQDNTGVEAAHQAGTAAERGVTRTLRRNRKRLREKPYSAVRRAESRLARTNGSMAYHQLLRDNPGLQKKTFAKWVQKQKIKRKYAEAAREAAKGAENTAGILTASGRVVRSLVQDVAVRRTASGIAVIGILLMAMSGALFSSCSVLLTGIGSAILSTCYVADDAEINRSELRYTELETDLQIDIGGTETGYPGYDEYRYSIAEIGHNPYELMGYLSAVYGDFTYAQVEAELLRLFGLQYRLTREKIVETRTYTDDEGNEQEYEWHVLKTTLAVQSLSEIIAANLPAGDAADLYSVYMQTCGNRQCYGSPFDFSWIPCVTGPCGYRVHPVTGEKDLHPGVDIGAPGGTPVLAVQDGRVVSAGDSGDFGLCVVVKGEDGCRSLYAHCASLSVAAGQEVKRGDIVAAVGNTGSATGTYLHLEVSRNGEYLNPYYYVDSGSGYPPGGAAGPDFPDDPGSAMGDGSFAAMLAEAEKYLGYPYVWGGSSPSTSFDCSGYVSWVINHSGVGNVGRQTAQGLYNLCTPVSRENLMPGDLVFFTGTYSSANPVTHVGIYVGGNRMIHCGNPVSYADITGSYWVAHFYSGGRLP